MQNGEPPIARRRVFYLPGFDPFPPRRYRELYRKEAAAQAAISGHDITLAPGPQGGPFGWRVTATIEGRACESEFTVLTWADIVQAQMGGSVAATYAQMLRTAWIYLSTGALFRLMRLRKGPVIAALYPVAFLLAQLALALALAWGLGQLLGRLHPWAAWAGLLVVPPVLHWFRRQDGRFFAYYLMQDYAHAARLRGATDPALQARLDEFSEAIGAALRDARYDEVLVVGHSSGAHLAVMALAPLLRGGRVPANGPRLSLLTLGQVVPMVGFLPKAAQLRADLQLLSEAPQLTWVDVTAPGDGCAFALCDPVAVCGVAREGRRGPLVFSAAFTQSLSPARWRALRWRFFRLHFQYLCAFDRVRDYDYFAITAGPRSLAARYAGRPASRSRITRTASGYTDVAA